MDNFFEWCELNQLQLNINKTKELVVDLRRSWSPVTPMSIRGVDVEIVQVYKYLGLHLYNKLDWAKNVLAIYKKGQSMLYFAVNSSHIESAILCCGCGGQCIFYAVT